LLKSLVPVHSKMFFFRVYRLFLHLWRLIKYRFHCSGDGREPGGGDPAPAHLPWNFAGRFRNNFYVQLGPKSANLTRQFTFTRHIKEIFLGTESAHPPFDPIIVYYRVWRFSTLKSRTIRRNFVRGQIRACRVTVTRGRELKAPKIR
jgi:hypothetical protein